MIRERRGVGNTYPEVGRVGGDRDRGGNKGVVEKRNWKKETVNPRRPRKGGRGVICNMKKSMVIMGGIKELKMRFET